MSIVKRQDQACRWAETRELIIHPKTGALQMVELHETAPQVSAPKYLEAARRQSLPLAHTANSELLSFGVPPTWLESVKSAGEDTIRAIAAHLPAEAAEAVLDLAIGEKPKAPLRLPAGTDPFEHPDSERRFRVMRNVEELERALDYPREIWSVFLHPAQRTLVERDYNGPARVAGSAGTGKTIVALHRAAFVARANPTARVLLTTLSEALADALSFKLRALTCNEPRLAERIEVHSLDTIACHLYELQFEEPNIASDESIQAALMQASQGRKFSSRFLLDEYLRIVDAWQIDTWQAYRDVAARGRQPRLPEDQLRVLWSIFEQASVTLQSRHLVIQAGIFARLTAGLAQEAAYPFDFVVVDDAQDMSIAQLRWVAALAADRPNALFFAGDPGQRTIQQPFSWRALGVDVSSRSSTLRINYRTSQQILAQIGRLLGPQVSDVDGNTDDRSEEQLPRALAAAESVGLPTNVLDEHLFVAEDHVSIAPMPLAKGLEFRAVAVIACDASIIDTSESDIEGCLPNRAPSPLHRLHPCPRPSLNLRRLSRLRVTRRPRPTRPHPLPRHLTPTRKSGREKADEKADGKSGKKRTEAV
jgi:superfamily I DNA/RNA helicase